MFHYIAPEGDDGVGREGGRAKAERDSLRQACGNYVAPARTLFPTPDPHGSGVSLNTAGVRLCDYLASGHGQNSHNIRYLSQGDTLHSIRESKQGSEVVTISVICHLVIVKVSKKFVATFYSKGYGIVNGARALALEINEKSAAISYIY